jgi:hypothetical protein
VSSLADPASRTHKVGDLIRAYEKLYGDFPHDRVHSTMRVYLDNDRLAAGAPVLVIPLSPRECLEPHTVGTRRKPSGQSRLRASLALRP